MRGEPDQHQLEAAAEILRALADPHRLRVLMRLAKGELNVGQLAELEKEKMQTMSARLKVLLAARLVNRRRAGQMGDLRHRQHARSQPRGQCGGAGLRDGLNSAPQPKERKL